MRPRVEVSLGGASASENRGAIAGLREALLAWHLGVAPEQFADALRTAGGSLIDAIDALVRPDCPMLVPLAPPLLSEADRRLAETHVLDPHRPEAMARTFARTLRLIVSRPAAGAVGLFAWRRRVAA